MLTNLDNYRIYSEFVQNGTMVVQVSTIDKETWYDHFIGLLNILKDGIETDFVQRTFVTVSFGPELDCELSIVDLFYNIIMWKGVVSIGGEIQPCHLLFNECETQGTIKKFIDFYIIRHYRNKVDTVDLNIAIDDILESFSNIDDFSFYFANTINLEDDIALMEACPEYYDLLHPSVEGIPIDSINNYALELAKKGTNIIKHSKEYLGYDHCLTDSWRSKQGINIKQDKEFRNIIGTKPTGDGGVYPYVITTSFINGGLSTLAAQVMESATGRTAQILTKGNTGDSGKFARILGMNNQDSGLYPDPNYVCDSMNFEEITIENEEIFSRLSVTGRWYRLKKYGIEKQIKETDTWLIGRKIFLRSPMTCASAARGKGICYRCYGDLAYTNKNINVGKIAAEIVSERFTQKNLSAKHLLESKIKSFKWCEDFNSFFDVDANIIKLQSDIDLSGCSILIDPESITLENENDYKQGDEDSGANYNEYINKFTFITKSRSKHEIYTELYDNLYITVEMNELIRSKAKPEDGMIRIQLDNTMNDMSLFAMEIHNNELSETMNKIMAIINLNSETISYNKDELLEVFVKTLCEGGLDIDSVHCEILLSNQLRSVSTDGMASLEKPNWSVPDVPYQVLTLNQALNTNPSVTIRLSYDNVPRALYNPLTFKMHSPSFMDLFFMEKPQEFLNSKEEIVPTKKIDREQNFEVPITKIEDDDIQD